MTLITKILNKLKNLTLFLLPLSYIIYIVYIRLFLIRDPRILFVKLSYTQIILTMLIILGLLFRIYILLNQEKIIPENKKETPLRLWLTNKTTKLTEFIGTIWVNFFRFFTEIFLNLNFLIIRFVKILFKYKFSNYVLIILIIFEVLPKIIIVLAFLVDIFVYKQFYFFYKSLILLVFPIIYSTLRAILLQFYYDNKESQDRYIKETLIIKNASFDVQYAFADDFEPPSYIKDLNDFLENYYLPLCSIPGILSYYDAVKIYYKLNWLFIVILILHLFGWLTILFFGVLAYV